ncbi:MAG TPA: NAD(P)-dependent oxidoreductase [Microlunatus sp.]
MQSTTSDLAVIGLGAMGGRAAAALATSRRVHGFDPAPAARATAEAAGVQAADSVLDAVSQAQLIFLSLPTPAVVRSVIDDLEPVLQDKIIFDLSTIDPGTARDLASGLAHRNVGYVDAPILGRPDRCGHWTLPCGGSSDQVSILREVAVGTIARAVEHVGPAGAGATVKICNNLMFGAINTVTAEVVALAEQAGVDAERFSKIISDSGAATVSPLFREIAPRMAEHRYQDPTFSITLLAKDIRLGVELAEGLDRPHPVAETVRRIIDRALEDELGVLDTSAVVEVYRTQPPKDTGS